MRNIPTPWPAPDILDMLVWKSSGYFIYAATVIKFIDDEYSRPSKQLDIIQNLVSHDSESPFKALDQLYHHILLGVPARSRSSLCDILSVIIHYPMRTIAWIPWLSASDIEELLGLEPSDVLLILRPLHSVLKYDPKHCWIDMHHASFHDFLNNQERSSILYIGSPQHRANLARAILKALAYTFEDQQKNRANSLFRWCVHVQHHSKSMSIC
jgi:hypothetical protein